MISCRRLFSLVSQWHTTEMKQSRLHKSHTPLDGAQLSRLDLSYRDACVGDKSTSFVLALSTLCSIRPSIYRGICKQCISFRLCSPLVLSLISYVAHRLCNHKNLSPLFWKGESERDTVRVCRLFCKLLLLPNCISIGTASDIREKCLLYKINGQVTQLWPISTQQAPRHITVKFSQHRFGVRGLGVL